MNAFPLTLTFSVTSPGSFPWLFLRPTSSCLFFLSRFLSSLLSSLIERTTDPLRENCWRSNPWTQRQMVHSPFLAFILSLYFCSSLLASPSSFIADVALFVTSSPFSPLLRPWIELNGEVIGDSHIIIKKLKKHFNGSLRFLFDFVSSSLLIPSCLFLTLVMFVCFVPHTHSLNLLVIPVTMDDNLTEQEQATDTAVQRMLEDHMMPYGKGDRRRKREEFCFIIFSLFYFFLQLRGLFQMGR